MEDPFSFLETRIMSTKVKNYLSFLLISSDASNKKEKPTVNIKIFKISILISNKTL